MSEDDEFTFSLLLVIVAGVLISGIIYQNL
jgi:hypothetical protein